RSLPGEGHVDEEPDDDGRQGESGMDQGHHEPPPGKPGETDRNTDRETDHYAEKDRDPRDTEREEHDPEEVDAPGGEEPERFVSRIEEEVHAADVEWNQ